MFNVQWCAVHLCVTSLLAYIGRSPSTFMFVCILPLNHRQCTPVCAYLFMSIHRRICRMFKFLFDFNEFAPGSCYRRWRWQMNAACIAPDTKHTSTLECQPKNLNLNEVQRRTTKAIYFTRRMRRMQTENRRISSIGGTNNTIVTGGDTVTVASSSNWMECCRKVINIVVCACAVCSSVHYALPCINTENVVRVRACSRALNDIYCNLRKRMTHSELSVCSARTENKFRL